MLMRSVSHRAFLLFVASLWLCGANCVAAQKSASFPGARFSIQSPDGRYVVLNEDSDTREPAHRLLLKKKGSKVALQVLSYGRSVDVLWSPDSSHLIVVDHEGSDSTNSFIFTLPGMAEPVDLRAEMESKLRENRSVFQNHHVYIKAVRWMNPNTIRLKIWGYGNEDPKGFTLWLDYKLGGDFRLIGKKL
jgi:dipeptidyl aminopeptidase/acylaminoacyl peptidase